MIELSLGDELGSFVCIICIDVLLLNSGVGDVIICKCSIYDFCKIVN